MVAPGSLLLRRANCLVAWLDDGALVVENYLTGRQTEMHPQLLAALRGLVRPQPREKVAAALAVTQTPSVIDQLIAQDVLLPAGADLERRDASIHDGWAWGLDARYFHYSTRRTAFTYNLEQERDQLLELAKREPPPPPFKDYGRGDVPLGADAPAAADLWGTLSRRRTGRQFGREPLTLHQLSTVLEWTWGIRELRYDPGIGPVALKTSPSGGARHPVEVYPVVLDVAGVEPGVYHYCSGRAVLERMRSGDFAADVVRACTDQPWVADAGVVCFMTGVIERSSWKYRQSHAYRVLLLDAGHLGQTFHLAATAVGLSPWTSAALNEEEVERLIGTDGVSEIVLYAAACGLPPSCDG
jgi:SagB-type dehydrogenase family enzyme